MLIAVVVAFVSCEKVNLDSAESDIPANANLILKVVGSDDTRTDGEYWNRLHFVVYQDGTKVADKSQTAGDDGYGQAAIALAEGTYQVLVLAHSSNGSPSLASAEKIQFTNANGFTDTFYFYGDITVTSEPQTHEITLERATAMLRFIINDTMPANVRSMKFYYTGGSGALNAKTGFGCVASKQTVNVDIDPETLTNPYIFELYTIPHEQKASLTLTVTAYDESQNVVCERTFKGVEVEKNKITEFAGNFFTGGEKQDDNPDETPTPGQDTFVIRANTQWAGTLKQTY